MLFGVLPFNARSIVELMEIQKEKLKFPSKPVRSRKIKELIGSNKIYKN
jgi:hypothetical protein